MYPVIFKIGSFEVLTSGLFWCLGFGCALIVLLYISIAENREYFPLVKMALCCLCSGIVWARLGFIQLHWEYFFSDPLQMLKFYEGGMVYYWGLCGGILGGLFYWRKRQNLLSTCDAMVLALIPAQIMGRMGCFFHGCCFGLTIDEFPFSKSIMVTFPGESVMRHPTQLYSCLLLSLIFIVLIYLHHRYYRPGLTLVSYIYLYGIARFTIEIIRADYRGTFLGISYFSTSQGIAVSSILLVSLYLITKYYKRRAVACKFTQNLSEK